MFFILFAFLSVVIVLFQILLQTFQIARNRTKNSAYEKSITNCCYAKAVLKFAKLNTAAQQREAIVQGRSLSPYRLRYLSRVKKSL
ncbi:MAG: hypothetical protein LBK06_02800 [Planctomycetaceae bacterium]|nr:hypothetical protein [Planctomycetaceae bacterium]